MGEKTQKQLNNKELSARLMAVQAYYQISHNAKPVRLVVQEYLDRGLHMDIDGVEMVQPHSGLFKKILFNLDDRLAETSEILMANIHKREVVSHSSADVNTDDEIVNSEIKPATEKDIEPLLKAILLCAVCEILVHQDIDAPLIINDYLNVTHAFYEQQQVSFVNGILDNVASLIRG